MTTAPAASPALDRRPGGWARALPPLSAVIAAVVVWWVITTVISAPQSLLRQAAPQRVLPALADLLGRGVLLSDTGISLWRLLIGLLVAAVVGIPVGLSIGLSATAERATAPVVQFLRMISPLSWAPIAVAVFGIGNEPVIFLIAAAAVWPVVINTAAGVHAIEPGYLDVARSFHATRIELLKAVVLPAVRGHVLTGLRIALGIGWVVLVPAEMLGVRSGLGYQVLNARDQLAYDQVVAVIVVIGSLGYLLDLVARRVLAVRT
ncbi:putative sulfonate ABC transporter permease [Mycolicibacterium mageritense DSM 44476 = CIP 104973]|uniref:Sulfonate ABC transporter, permease n=1 Tax=Mycolicibacterium mageritense TaxID=53462 RepID=A0ABN5YGB4_MYCME|nr:ABC transporter permease [Mycolicibacterium mageritense]MCC9186670.1 ABC transporter permease [Mycolicibacterium mageritense]BBX36758.1 putative sulfonate ABC transporter, permease [Mycolicibacterium mageritense]CDO26389.1 putative sulfonate ABC transporter permease [Mycolicibacterium mageritense DSM 44476 = CIP 104973]